MVFSEVMGDQSQEKRLVQRVPATMSALLAIPEEEVQVREVQANDVDLMVSAAGRTFAVEVVGVSSAGVVATRAERAAKSAKATDTHATPVLAVPFMGESGKQAL